MMNKRFGIAVLAAALAATGCANMDETQRGTAIGAGVGAGLGAIIGGTTGKGGGGRAAAGAIIGGATGAVAGNVWSSRMEQQKRQMEQATQGTGVQVSQTADNRLKLEIPSDISFDTNRADIKPNFRPVLDRFAATLQDNPAINNPLSVNRASSTRGYLVNRGVSMNRFTIDGRGSYEPIASNANEAGRARNRRVEIFVAEQQAATQAPAPAPVPRY
jgi:outer membrane protein OmpA-like peptidoglycan-associated protein